MSEQSKKTIWLICKYASPLKYFFGTRHFYLAEEWVKKGHEVIIFTSNSSHLSDSLPRFSGKYMKEQINGVQTIWLNTYKSKSSSGLSRIISWLHFEWQVMTISKKNLVHPDVVIVSSLSLLSVFSGLFFKNRYKSKFILEIRDIWPLSIIELKAYSKNNLFVKVLVWIEKLGYRKADAIVGTMPNLSEHVNNVIESDKKVSCIPQGISPAYSDKMEQLPKSYIEKHFPKNKFIICYIGTINRNNSIEVLLKAASELINDRKLGFLVLGSGDFKSEYEQKYGHLENLQFLDPIRKTQVNHFLQHVDLCFDSIESSIGRFGLSRNKWIDYMYASKPIICSTSGFQSMINEACCGSFLPANDVDSLVKEIKKYALMESEEITAMGKRGYNYLMEYRTFDKLADQYINLMESL